MRDRSTFTTILKFNRKTIAFFRHFWRVFVEKSKIFFRIAFIVGGLFFLIEKLIIEGGLIKGIAGWLWFLGLIEEYPY